MLFTILAGLKISASVDKNAFFSSSYVVLRTHILILAEA